MLASEASGFNQCDSGGPCREAYNDALRTAEALVMNQVNSVAKLFSAFLPFSGLK